jgi:hypothetical protein
VVPRGFAAYARVLHPFESIIVGGSEDLISAMLTAPGLDAWPVEPDDDLTAFADLPNSSS